MERTNSEFIGSTQGMEDQYDLVNLLQFQDAPLGLDELLPMDGIGNSIDGILKAELSDSEGSRGFYGQLSGDAAADNNLQGGDEGKRRRRIRNAKQQELNRLAQQRYRQRKKQKYTDLQSTVDELSNKTEQVARLEREANEMRGRQAVVQGLLTTREIALKHAHSQMQQQQRLLEEQQKRIREQQQQLEILKQQQQPPESTVSGAAAESAATPLSQPQEQLYDRLLSALREALIEVCSEHGLATSPPALDQVVQKCRTSLSSCCKEVLSSPPSAEPTATALLQAAQPVTAAAVVGLVPPVTTTSQVKEATHCVSVTCY